MKSVRLLSFVIRFCLLFWTSPCTTFNSIPIILKLLTTNRNIALIYSVTICEQKTLRRNARSGSFQHELQHRCFQLWRLPAFKTRLLYKPWFVGLYSEKLPFLLYIFILSGQSRDKASLNNYKGILFGLPRKKKRYIIFGWKQRHFQTHALSASMSSLSFHQGARKAHPAGEILILGWKIRFCMVIFTVQ